MSPTQVKKNAPDFGTLAVALGFLSKDQLNRALELQKKSHERGEVHRLGEICLKYKMLGRGDVLVILRAQGKRILCCDTCRKAYNVPHFRRDKEYRCKHCKRPLQIPEKSVQASVNGELTQGDTRHVSLPRIDAKLRHLLPQYEIVERLGQGGMGMVFKAQDLILNRFVAVKLLSPLLAENREFVARFFREARLAKKIRHPNIVEVYDAGIAGGYQFFLMEFIEGPSVDWLIGKRKKLDESEALDIVCQTALGLAHAWRKRIVHRDIKPGNIMLAPGNVVKICDLGLSKDVTSDISLTMTGNLYCSPSYASPEQCRGERNLDCRSDSYSLGVTLFEMLTGRLPFLGDAAGALILQHVTQKPPDPLKLNPDISKETAALLMRLLEKKPNNRPTPAEIAREVSQLLQARQPF